MPTARTASSHSSIALVVIGLLLGASALAFGSVEFYAREWMRFGALLALAAAVWRERPTALFGGVPGRLALPIVLLIAWGIVQLSPLPMFVLDAVAPGTVELYQGTVPPEGGSSLPAWLLDRAESEGGNLRSPAIAPGPDEPGAGAIGRSVSIYPYATWRACLSWITMLLAFFAAAHISRSETGRYWLLWCIAGWTGVLGAIAVVQKLTWNGQILWLRHRAAGTQPLGPFVNPNHYAGWVELGILVALGLSLAILSRPSGSLTRVGVREVLLDRQWALPRLLVLVMLIIPAVFGLMVSGSRGGLAALGAGLLFLVFARRARGVATAAACGVVLLGVGFGVIGLLGLQGEPSEAAPFLSTDTSPSLHGRLEAWSYSLEIFIDHPVTGTGLGTFEQAFGVYQQSPGVWQAAHNDYLQFLAEAGSIGALLFLWALIAFVGRVVWPLLHGRHPRWTTVAVLAAVFAMMVHSAVDFNLQIPSNALLFVTLLGILAGIADRQGEQRAGAARAT